MERRMSKSSWGRGFDPTAQRSRGGTSGEDLSGRNTTIALAVPPLGKK